MQTSENGSKVRVLVADDNKLMREKIVQLMQPDFDVVGTAADGDSALEMALQLKPDIVVLDISMPVISGIEVAMEMKKKSSTAKIIMLTVHEDPDFVKAAFDAGASSYVIKSNMASDLTDALWAVNEGEVYISPNCALNGD